MFEYLEVNDSFQSNSFAEQYPDSPFSLSEDLTDFWQSEIFKSLLSQ